jgi:hypothetical protein
MKRIKKFNELFDNEDLKGMHEIETLTGALDIRKLSSELMSDKKSGSADSIYRKLTFRFPFFVEYNTQRSSNINWKESSKGAYTFYMRDDKWFTSITIKEENNKYTLVLLYQDVNAALTKGDNSKVVKGLDFKGQEYTHVEDYYDISLSEVYDHIEYKYIPLLVKLGFEDVISGHDVRAIRFN